MMIDLIFTDLLSRIENKLSVLLDNGEIESINIQEITFTNNIFKSQVIIKKTDGTIKDITKSSRCPIQALLLMLIEYTYYIEGLPEDLRCHYTSAVMNSHDHNI